MLRNCNEMNMIPHQAPGQHPHPGVRQTVGLQAQIRRSVGILEKDPLTVGPSLGDMVRLTRQHTALISRHFDSIVPGNHQKPPKWQRCLPPWPESPTPRVRLTPSRFASCQADPFADPFAPSPSRVRLTRSHLSRDSVTSLKLRTHLKL